MNLRINLFVINEYNNIYDVSELFFSLKCFYLRIQFKKPLLKAIQIHQVRSIKNIHIFTIRIEDLWTSPESLLLALILKRPINRSNCQYFLLTFYTNKRL